MVRDSADGLAGGDDVAGVDAEVDETARVRPHPGLLAVCVDDTRPRRFDAVAVVHLEVGHDGFDAGERAVDVLLLEPVGFTHLDGDGRDVAGSAGRANRVPFLAGAGERDVRAERVVEAFHAVVILQGGACVEHRRSAARRRVEVEAVVAVRENAAVDGVRDAACRLPGFLPREEPVEVLVVEREVALLGAVGGDVHDVDDDEDAVEVRWMEPVDGVVRDFHAVEFVAVDGRGEKEHGAVPVTVHDGDGNPDFVAEEGLVDGEVRVVCFARGDVRPTPLERAGVHSGWSTGGYLSISPGRVPRFKQQPRELRAMSIKYADFVDESYDPDPDDLVCTFRLVPGEGLSLEAAAGRVASESSNGTWAALDAPERVRELSAMAFDLAGDADGGEIRVAYPDVLFDPGNMPQVLSCIAGNILGMKAVETIRLLDCEWPAALATSFLGPQYGPSVKSEILDAEDRPATATVPKPKVGLNTEEHAEIGYEAWVGGVDLLKDDENLTDQAFNRFDARLKRSLELRDRAEAETGEAKDYLVNITGETSVMLDRVDQVAAQGGGFVMVDVITTGWSAVQSVRERCEEQGLAIHAHRAMHAAFDRLPQHGVSMRVLAQIGRIVGVDHIHTGTAGLGKLENEDTVGINAWLRDDFHGVEPVLPVASGGLHPGIVEPLLDATGTDVMVQAGGGIHGHPDGTRAGAAALRQSVDAYVAGVSPEAYAEDHEELAAALEEWGTESPR